MKKYLPFGCLWLLNSIVLYVASFIFPSDVVLGNANLSSPVAALVAGLIITIIGWVAKPIFWKFGIRLKGNFQMFVFYWGANSAAVWLTARFAYLTGLGISSYLWALGLGLVLNFLQWSSWQGFKRRKLV